MSNVLNLVSEESFVEQTDKIADNLARIAAYMQAANADEILSTLTSPQRLHELIQSGLAPKVLSVGDQIVVNHSVYGDISFDIIGFDHDADANGLYDHTITVQSHAIIDKLAFDANENEVATEAVFSADYCYYVAAANNAFTLLTAGTDYNVGDSIPSGTTYYHTAINDPSGKIVRYGYNNWEHSAIRQWLNSEATAGAWWSAKHPGDVAPNYATTKDGFLNGLDADFKDIIGTTRKITLKNAVTDGGGSTELTEKVFLLSVTEASGAKSNNPPDGEAYEYYSRLLGSATNSSGSGRIKYYSGNASIWYFRNPTGGHSYSPRLCDANGGVINGYSSNGNYGIVPAFILV